MICFGFKSCSVSSIMLTLWSPTANVKRFPSLRERSERPLWSSHGSKRLLHIESGFDFSQEIRCWVERNGLQRDTWTWAWPLVPCLSCSDHAPRPFHRFLNYFGVRILLVKLYYYVVLPVLRGFIYVPDEGNAGWKRSEVTAEKKEKRFKTSRFPLKMSAS